MGAGKSSRFSDSSGNQSEQKQYKCLGDETLIFYTLNAFIIPEIVSQAVLVVSENQFGGILSKVKDKNYPIPVDVISGGAERQDSVQCGVDCLGKDVDVVIVHDAVRPFVLKKWIEKTVELCSQYDGAIVAIRLNDTLKKVKNHEVQTTVNRENTWRAQTPQTFNMEILKKALKNAKEKSILATDEAQLVEMVGGQIAVLEGSPINIKITTRQDWELAEVIGKTNPW